MKPTGFGFCEDGRPVAVDPGTLHERTAAESVADASHNRGIFNAELVTELEWLTDALAVRQVGEVV